MIINDAARLSELGAESDLPFVAWDNWLTEAGVIITSNQTTLTDGALANAVSGTTYDFWLPDMAGTAVTYSAQFLTSRVPTFAAILGHNLGTLGATVKVQSSATGATWFDVESYAPTDDSLLAFRIPAASTARAYWRFRFEGLTVADPVYVAALFLGEEIIFPIGVYSGFAPPIYPTEVQLQSNVSVGGNLLGSSVIAQGTTLSAKMAYLSPSFVRTDLAGFIPAFNRGKPFWFAWRPETFTDDIRYCWRDGATIVPMNEGGLDYMSIQLAMRAYEE